MAVSDPGNNVKIYTITEGTQSGFPKEKHFCGNCGCTLWTVPRKYGGMIRMIRTSLLDNGLARYKSERDIFMKSVLD
ncbi:hypothetical protein PG984_007144 [Apiospora sp. TS-2023a]